MSNLEPHLRDHPKHRKPYTYTYHTAGWRRAGPHRGRRSVSRAPHSEATGAASTGCPRSPRARLPLRATCQPGPIQLTLVPPNHTLTSAGAPELPPQKTALRGPEPRGRNSPARGPWQVGATHSAVPGTCRAPRGGEVTFSGGLGPQQQRRPARGPESDPASTYLAGSYPTRPLSPTRSLPRSPPASERSFKQGFVSTRHVKLAAPVPTTCSVNTFTPFCFPRTTVPSSSGPPL